MGIDQDESRFLANYNIHDFEVPLCTVDLTIFTLIEDQLHVLLVQRARHPCQGQWALPGGFIDFNQDDTIEATARRQLIEKTGITSPYLEQVHTQGSNERDPRGWSVTVLYFALIASDGVELNHDHRSLAIDWVPYDHLQKKVLAFDHRNLIEQSYERLYRKVLYTSLPIHLLPETFTLPQLQRVYELLLQSPLQKRSFRKRMLDANIIEETGAMEPGVTRPAALYRAKENHWSHLFPRTLEGVTKDA